MKKLISWLLCVSMLLSVASCGKQPSSQQNFPELPEIGQFEIDPEASQEKQSSASPTEVSPVAQLPVESSREEVPGTTHESLPDNNEKTTEPSDAMQESSPQTEGAEKDKTGNTPVMPDDNTKDNESPAKTAAAQQTGVIPVVKPQEKEAHQVSEKPSQGDPENETAPADPEDLIDNDGNLTAPFDVVFPEAFAEEGCKYEEDHALLKMSSEFDGKLTEELEACGFISLKRFLLTLDGTWYKAELAEDAVISQAIGRARTLESVITADYDYIYENSDTVTEQKSESATDLNALSSDISENPLAAEQWYLQSYGIQEAWKFLKQHNVPSGGLSSVVIAVIDTGVDYTHPDLKANMWINTGEIPGNGIDDDDNGYVDDVYGINAVTDSGDPMDDHGHGTHVAGIIAATNNKEGIVGIAYNCRIMAIKAAGASGYFNNSDIAEAIQYAYLMGADVINMSFGGTAISAAVQDALQLAYSRCTLVAAAGNEGMVNELYRGCSPFVAYAPFYPAALTYVVGVMSSGEGNSESTFTNIDGEKYTKREYEVYAAGENIYSTFPQGKYTSLSGTSMATPMVSAIAALLRSYYSRDLYSSKYISAQLCSTGNTMPHCIHIDKYPNHYIPPTISAINALNTIPKPEVSVLDYLLIDYDDEVVDAGEDIELGLTLLNRWGMCKNTTVTLSIAGELGENYPYITLENNTADYGAIGTYSTKDLYLYDANKNISGIKNPIRFSISKECPDNYIYNLKVAITYENALDENDYTTYETEGEISFTVRNGVIRGGELTEDETWTKDNSYIVASSIYIPEGITLWIEEGTNVDFRSSIVVDGALNIQGTEQEPVVFQNTIIYQQNDGVVNAKYVIFSGYNEEGYATVTFLNGDCIIDHCIVETPFAWVGSMVRNTMFLSSMFDESKGTFENCFFQGIGYLDSQYKNITIKKSVLEHFDEIYRDIQIHRAEEIIGSVLINTPVSAPKGNSVIDFSGNYWDTTDIDLLIWDRADDATLCKLNPFPVLETAPEDVWPFVTDAYLADVNGNRLETVGNETAIFVVEFNRDMDTSVNLNVRFGSAEPYSEYTVEGSYVTARRWEGLYTFQTVIENGNQFMSFDNACAADDAWLKLYEPAGKRFGFKIDTSSALAMTMSGEATDTGIQLSWIQDDYETLAGYNVYRSTKEDGLYTRLNSSLLPYGEESFFDDTVEPGMLYYYNFTVVLTDLSESLPSGKIAIWSEDTMAPDIYHTPVTIAYTGSNLVIGATVTDNLDLNSVNLFYRIKGTEAWNQVEMTPLNSRYTAVIGAEYITLEGLEYYIEAYDGVNYTYKGTAEEPYSVTVQMAVDSTSLGDVDGDGVITNRDALMILQAVNDLLNLTEEQFLRADLNSDGELSGAEALRILYYVSGKITTIIR